MDTPAQFVDTNYYPEALEIVKLLGAGKIEKDNQLPGNCFVTVQGLKFSDKKSYEITVQILSDFKLRVFEGQYEILGRHGLSEVDTKLRCRYELS